MNAYRAGSFVGFSFGTGFGASPACSDRLTATCASPAPVFANDARSRLRGIPCESV